MTDSDFWDTRSEQLKRAFLAGKAGRPGVSSFISTRIKELRDEQGKWARGEDTDTDKDE